MQISDSLAFSPMIVGATQVLDLLLSTPAEEGLSYYEVVELAHLAPTRILFPNLVMEGLSCEVLELILYIVSSAHES